MDLLAIFVFVVSAGTQSVGISDPHNPSYKPNPLVLSQTDLTSFNYFVRGQIARESLDAARDLSGRASESSISEDVFEFGGRQVIYTWKRNGLAGVVVSKEKQPIHKVASLLLKVFQEVRDQSGSIDLNKLEKDEDLASRIDTSYLNYKGPLEIVKSQLDEVKGLLNETILAVINRGEKLEDLVKKTEAMQHSTGLFQERSRQLRRKYQWCPCF